MRKVAAVLLLGVSGVLAGILPMGASSVQAAGTPSHQRAINWNQHDTAVYVVSTLNLLHTKNGHSFTSLLTSKLNVSHYDVYADQEASNLYFIQLKRDDGSVAGVFAYQIGWSQPQILFLASTRRITRHANDKVAEAYRTDGKQLIGSFTSTLPS